MQIFLSEKYIGVAANRPEMLSSLSIGGLGFFNFLEKKKKKKKLGPNACVI